MPLDQQYIQDVATRLNQQSENLGPAFREALTLLPADLSDDLARIWADEAVAVAEHSVRSWEACADYLAAAPSLLTTLDDAAFARWAATGRALAELATPIAGAYYRSSPQVLPMLAGAQVTDWAKQGESLYKATWKSISLASEFFLLSPALLQGLSLQDLGRLSRVLEGISDRSADLATACLEATPLGLPVYERLGFRRRFEYQVIGTPPR